MSAEVYEVVQVHHRVTEQKCHNHAVVDFVDMCLHLYMIQPEAKRFGLPGARLHQPVCASYMFLECSAGVSHVRQDSRPRRSLLT